MNVHSKPSHEPKLTRHAVRIVAAALLSVIALAGGLGAPLTRIGSANAQTTTTTTTTTTTSTTTTTTPPINSTCGMVTAYTAASATSPGSLSLMVGSATSATTTTIALGAVWTGIPIVVGNNICLNSTLDANGALTGGTVSGAIVTPSSGLFTVGPYIFAHAKLFDGAGTFSGTATLAQDTGTGLVYIGVTVFNPALTAGLHGIHIHAVGSCVGPTFASAGDHFNPLNKQHGLDNPAGPHAGDLPNISVNSSGNGDLEAVSNLFTLTAGPTSILGTANGTSIVVHSGTDDQMTNPSGNSDGRVLCGVIQAG